MYLKNKNSLKLWILCCSSHRVIALKVWVSVWCKTERLGCRKLDWTSLEWSILMTLQNGFTRNRSAVILGQSLQIDITVVGLLSRCGRICSVLGLFSAASLSCCIVQLEYVATMVQTRSRLLFLLHNVSDQEGLCDY